MRKLLVILLSFACLQGVKGQTAYFYHYWFDNNGTNNYNTGNATGQHQFDIDISGFSENVLHSLHIQAWNTPYGYGPVRTTFFIRPSAAKTATTARYWFDNDETTQQTASPTGVINLSVDDFTPGIHAVHYQTFAADGTPSSVRTSFFLLTADQLRRLTCSIWLDDAEGAAQTYDVTDEAIELDVSSLSVGTHEVHIALFDEIGAYVDTKTVEFEIPIPTETITLSAALMGTYCSEHDLDFTGVEGIAAYIATGYNTKTGKVTMGRVYDVPAGTGLFIKGDAGAHEIPQVQSFSYYVNLLVGLTEPTAVPQQDGEFTNYTLQNGVDGIGFYYPKNSTVAAHRAYLHVPNRYSEGVKQMGITFEEDLETAIRSVQDNADEQPSTYYNLMGQPVDHPQKRGIYIQGKKKVFIP